MASTTNRWKLGLFVLVSVAVLLASLVWLGASRLQRESLQAHYFFDEEVSGLDVGAPVEYRGVKIGKVTAIRLAPDHRHVEVISDLYLDALEQLGLPTESRPKGPEEGPFAPPDLRVQLVTSVLTGVTIIQSDFFDERKYPVPDYPFEVPWNTVHSAPSAYKSLEQGLLSIIDYLPTLTEQSTALVRDVREGLEELELAGLSEETRGSLAELHGLLTDLRAPEGPLQGMIRRYEAIGAQLEGAFGESDLPATAAAVRRMSADVGRATLDFGRLTDDIRAELDSLWEALDSVRRLSDLLERDPGALLHGRTTNTMPR